jgi:hypothetical protein
MEKKTCEGEDQIDTEKAGYKEAQKAQRRSARIGDGD